MKKLKQPDESLDLNLDYEKFEKFFWIFEDTIVKKYGHEAFLGIPYNVSIAPRFKNLRIEHEIIVNIMKDSVRNKVVLAFFTESKKPLKKIRIYSDPLNSKLQREIKDILIEINYMLDSPLIDFETEHILISRKTNSNSFHKELKIDNFRIIPLTNQEKSLISTKDIEIFRLKIILNAAKSLQAGSKGQEESQKMSALLSVLFKTYVEYDKQSILSITSPVEKKINLSKKDYNGSLKRLGESLKEYKFSSFPPFDLTPDIQEKLDLMGDIKSKHPDIFEEFIDSCFLYKLGLTHIHSYPSLSIVCFVASIENLAQYIINGDKKIPRKCEKFGVECEHIQKIGAIFREFAKYYLPSKSHIDIDSLLKESYNIRSGLVHKGRIRVPYAELNPSFASFILQDWEFKNIVSQLKEITGEFLNSYIKDPKIDPQIIIKKIE